MDTNYGIVSQCPVEGPRVLIETVLSSKELFQMSDRGPVPFIRHYAGAHVGQEVSRLSLMKMRFFM